MTDTLTITPDMVGKYVRCRSGQRAYILCITPEWAKEPNWSRVIGYYQRTDYSWANVSWSLEGLYIDNDHHDCHIISLWVDEEPEEDQEEKALRTEAQGDALGQAAINYRLYKIEKRMEELKTNLFPRVMALEALVNANIKNEKRIEALEGWKERHFAALQRCLDKLNK